MSVLSVLSGLSTAAGKGYDGYGQDQQIKVRNALALRNQEEEERRNRVLETVAGRTQRTPLVTGVGPNGQPVRVEDVPGASVYEAPKPAGMTTVVGPGGNPIRGADVAGAPVYVPPEKPKDPNLITVPDPKDPYKLIRAPDVAGQEVPGPTGSSGGATMKKAIASNVSQLSIIEDALKELDAHPDAVGLKRGAGDIPVIGGLIGDPINQRLDPAGVAARASLANIASLKVHDRSGGAVTISEYPRLAAFIPKVSDNLDAIKIKLGKLREAIKIETEALGGGTKGSASTPAIGSREAAEAHLKSQGKTAAQIRQILGPP